MRVSRSVAVRLCASTVGNESTILTTRKRIVSNKLVIVESPTKVKSISKYLGDEYTVMASVGHIRDLIEPKNLSLIHI